MGDQIVIAKQARREMLTVPNFVPTSTPDQQRLTLHEFPHKATRFRLTLG